MDRPKPIDRNDPDFELKNSIAMQINFFRFSGKTFNATVEDIFANAKTYFTKDVITLTCTCDVDVNKGLGFDLNCPLHGINNQLDPVGLISFLSDGHKVVIKEVTDKFLIGVCSHGDRFELPLDSKLYKEVLNK